MPLEGLLICVAALLASLLTLFSGFGLGTLLMPVIALFFPLPLAVAMTAVVHFANNLFKLALLGRKASLRVLLRFGLPAMLLALVGASLLTRLGGAEPLLDYELFGQQFVVVPLGLLIGVLIIFFVALDLSPTASAIRIDPKWLPLGGAISGFFGGLSGHQGAFRSMFLLKTGLDKEAFVATGIVLAVMVDTARLFIYGGSLLGANKNIDWWLVGAACVSAFLGAFVGRQLLKKVTFGFVQIMVSALLCLIGLGLITGLLRVAS